MVAARLVRIEVDDQFKLPVDVRQRICLRKGDVVAVIEIEHGILRAPREERINPTLGEIGSILAMEGLRLDEVMESGAEIRDDLVQHHGRFGPSRVA